ncbi:MAG: DUF5103 domain-containing protein [Flavobacteriales bacterium]|nr:DUF5103 domain-containing protein [Flavobacteriales bacterium]
MNTRSPLSSNAFPRSRTSLLHHRHPRLVIGVTALFALACSSTGALTDGPGDPPSASYYSASELRYDDRTYDPDIHTVQLFRTGFELGAPVIELGSDQTLDLRFDDWKPTIQDLNYTVEHCTHDWQPSDMSKGEYLQGAFSDLIATPRQSYTTYQTFFEYTLTWPNRMMQPLRSGNYLLKVFRDGDEDDLVLTRRFMITEKRVDIAAQVVATRHVDLRDVAQQVDLTISHPGLDIADPFSDLHVTVLQNMNWNDARTGLKPKFVRNNELIYDHPPQAEFMGLNEFRNFDLKDLNYPTQYVGRIESADLMQEAYLVPQPARNIHVYLQEPDINGRYLVRNDIVDGDPLGADYVGVNFTLTLPEQLYGGAVYVWGGLSDFACRKAFRMTWDEPHHRYFLHVPLKQGWYDYMYAFLRDNSDQPDIERLEGSHYETENDYAVLVYFTDPMQRCDRLVGVRFVNSRKG